MLAYVLFGAMPRIASADRHHTIQYGRTSHWFGEMAMTLRKHALLKPRRQMRSPLTIKDHQNSRFRVEPQHLLYCAILSQGGRYGQVREPMQILRERLMDDILVIAEGTVPRGRHSYAQGKRDCGVFPSGVGAEVYRKIHRAENMEAKVMIAAYGKKKRLTISAERLHLIAMLSKMSQMRS
jgi:hypothetical protein